MAHGGDNGDSQPSKNICTHSWSTHLIKEDVVPGKDILRLFEAAQKSWFLLAHLLGLSYSQTMRSPITASLTPSSSILPFGSWDSRNSHPRLFLSHFGRQDRLLVWDWTDRNFWQVQSEHSTNWSNPQKNISTNNGIIMNTISISLGHKPNTGIEKDDYIHTISETVWITQQTPLRYFSLSNPMLAIFPHPSTHQQLNPQLIPLLNSLIHLHFLRCCPYSLYLTASLHITCYRKASTITPVFNTLCLHHLWH